MAKAFALMEGALRILSFLSEGLSSFVSIEMWRFEQLSKVQNLHSNLNKVTFNYNKKGSLS